MDDATQRCFVSRMDSLVKIRQFVETVGATSHLSREDCLKLILIVEELFANSVIHGYKGDDNQLVWVSLQPCPGGVVLDYEDAAPAHDPLGSYNPVDTTALLSDQPVGGVGVRLIRKLAADASYRRDTELGRNCIRIVFTP